MDKNLQESHFYKLSIAPMLEITTHHFRSLLHKIQKKSRAPVVRHPFSGSFSAEITALISDFARSLKFFDAFLTTSLVSS